ncbi:E3 SUMO-protein ligase SIZ1-like isoform X1 [Cynara cardunculus var. scolymus]|uniref:E3 SUMO-protein ligase SIZ1-like isoform X1 n=1 Tax=Cynara cardunculus var. scolymus TaxID=59895 RepID=UPI000D630C5B|nr:E3 SUMO-protein ligase SIZ1-like isoform X1 [Cynara cardunculus var. scolymus]XP_024982903.1 E3 SUMO-protein ligase SIZ1-like isoform X1 [Cynara cardunculus var. scolymus]
MDLVASCKEKLAHFRIRELKDILTQLGLSKQGRKQDLTERILTILSDERVSGMWSKKNAVGKEEVAKLVDDIYRKMQDSGATDLASKARGVSDGSNNTKLKEEIEDTLQVEKVRCLCGSSLQADSMIKCEDPRCNVWQHISCVIIPEKPMEGILPAPPPKFYCELCRLGRADPFWVTVAHPLLPVKLTIANAPADGTNPMQSVEKTFQLTRVDKELLVKPEYDVQAWCMLLNDKVSYRMQWPQFAELQINGMPMRAINRPGSQLLGANGRDDGPIITPCTRDGINKISLTGCDSRVFCLGVRIVKRRTVQQILNLIPKESDGERFEDALARVRRCVGGGPATENADSDSDLEVVADSIPVNLRCPMSGSRMKIAGRFKPCAHMGCFDLEVFVEMNQRSRKWQCPICLKNYSLENIIIDPYFTRITSKMSNCGEDLTDIEVKPDGSWRAKAEDDRKSLGDLGQWHLPDGTLCVPVEVESKPKPEALKQVKQEGASEGHTGLKLGMKKNKNGFWEVRKPENLLSLSSGSKLPDNFMNNGNNMSSSATGSGRDEDTSVNQDGGGHFDYSMANGAELDSLTLNIDAGHGFTDRNLLAAAGDAEVIVLSDSEEEAENLISSGQIYKNSSADAAEGVAFSSLPLGITEPHPEDPSLVAGGTSCLGLFDTNDDGFGVPFWSLPSSNHGGPSFQLFGSDADPVDALVDVHHGDALGCPTSMGGGYPLAAETNMGSAALIPDSSRHQSNPDINDGLVDNPLAFGGDDPSLQLFLPTRPSEATEQIELTDQAAMSNGFRSDDWISLRLGGGGSGVHCDPAAAAAAASNGLNSRQRPPCEDGALNSLEDTASLLLGMSGGGRSDKSIRDRSDSPFSFPRQKRSVRPRLYLSIESDSEER